MSCTTTSSPERIQKKTKGELKRDGKNMHFNAGSASQKMIVDLISSANDIGMLYGIGDHLGKIKQDDLESRQLFSLPESRKQPVPLRLRLVSRGIPLSTGVNS